MRQFTHEGIRITYDDNYTHGNVSFKVQHPLHETQSLSSGEIKKDTNTYVYHPYGVDLTSDMCICMALFLEELNK